MIFSLYKKIHPSAGLFLLVIVLLGFSITGCATPASNEIVDVNPGEVLPDLDDGKCRVVFFRPSKFFGFAMTAPIYLDQKLVGNSRNGTYFIVDVAPGYHKVTISKKMWPGPGHTLVEFETQANDTIFVKTWIGGSSYVGRTNAGVVQADEALPVIKDLKKISPIESPVPG
jgi:hypothetical protein